MPLNPAAVNQLCQTDFPARIARLAQSCEELLREQGGTTHSLQPEPPLQVIHKPTKKKPATQQRDRPART